MVVNKIDAIRIIKGSFIIIYAYFGILKFFPGVSPADQLATETISSLTFDLIPAAISIKILAFFEVFIALCFIFKIKWALWLTFCHLVLTFSPLFILTELCFSSGLIPTLTGQYILKNLVLTSVLLVLYKELNAPNKAAD